jgi:ABC-2 type transport system permease protein
VTAGAHAPAAARHDGPAPALRTAHRAPADGLAGLGAMTRLVTRRNRVRLVVWFVVIVGLFAYVGDYYKSLFTTQKALDDFAALSNTPGIKALTGLSAAPATLGGAVWTKIWMTCALTLALGVVFLVTRNGRADEEAGRAELLRSRVLGQHASAAAAWLVIAALCALIGLFVTLSSLGLGLDPAGAGTAGSWAVGASLTGVGLMALGVGAVAGQLASTARGANALGSIVIVAFYALRMIGDLGNGALTWASPIGWGQQMAPWGADRWWPFALLIVLAAGLLVVAWLLEAHRDHGAGLIADRAGRADAPDRYASPLGLALRLQRGAIIGWSIAVVLGALLLGSVVDQMNRLLADAGTNISTILRGSGISALLGLMSGLIALIVAIFAIQSTTQLRTDEASGIVEPQLAGAISRTRWVLQRLLIPVVGAAVLLAVGGWLIGAGYGATIGDSSQGVRIAGAALVYWPAVMVLVGVAVLLFGYLPRLAVPLAWGVVAALWFVMLIGDALHLPTWVLDLLPFSATPYLPAESMRWTPLIVMTAIAVVLTWAGLGRFIRRDVQPG